MRGKSCFLVVLFVCLGLTRPVFGGSFEGQANQWVFQENNWYYIGEDGLMCTGWIQVDGSWYYLDETGKMVSDRDMWIQGKQYRFLPSGAWDENGQNVPGPGQEERGKTKGTWKNDSYSNSELNFRIRRPEGYRNHEDSSEDFLKEGMEFNFAFGSDDGEIQVSGITYRTDQISGVPMSAKQLATLMKEVLTEENVYHSSEGLERVFLGGEEYYKLLLWEESSVRHQIYVKQVDENGLFMLQVVYREHREGEVQKLLEEIG